MWPSQAGMGPTSLGTRAMSCACPANPDRKIVPTRTSLKDGGTTIDDEDQDPRILADYQQIVGEVC